LKEDELLKQCGNSLCKCLQLALCLNLFVACSIGAGKAQKLATALYSVCGVPLLLEVARTPEQREIGLMHRKSISPGKGMLFSFAYQRPLSFWMKNVPFAIDIAYFDQKGKLINSHTMAADNISLSDSLKARYPSQAPALYAVEVVPGFYSKVKTQNCVIDPLPKKGL